MREPAPDAEVAVARWRGGAPGASRRSVPEETPVALVHDGATTAVMMATPADLEDFGVGFSVTEGIIGEAGEIAELSVEIASEGVEVRMWLAGASGQALASRRRRLAGPVGCGLCGIESLKEATRPASRVGEGLVLSASDIHAAMDAMTLAQQLGARTRSVHAAGWWTRECGLWAVREDVGRHNALDKLAGAVVRAPSQTRDGLVVLTSRVSVEMIQKAAMMGAQAIAAVSAPTLLAIRTAEACGMTLAAVVRDDGFEVFTGEQRISA